MGRGLRRSALIWSTLGSLGFLVLPWYALPDGLFGLGWPARMLAERDLAPAVLQAVKFGRPWLLAPGLVLMDSSALSTTVSSAWAAARSSFSPPSSSCSRQGSPPGAISGATPSSPAPWSSSPSSSVSSRSFRSSAS